MAHLIVCLGSDKEKWMDVDAVIKLGFFEKIYIIANEFASLHYARPIVKQNIDIDIIRLNFNRPSEEIVPELYTILKKNFTQDKIQDLDIALNIISGNGKEHAVVISTLMKLGYGIRLVELDKDGGLLEMM